MIRRRKEIAPETREAIRGGSGRASQIGYLSPGEMAGVEFVSVLTLEPGASIGEHVHPDTEELYLVLEGEGLGRLDGETFQVGSGDAFVCKAGHSHGLASGPRGPLTFVAVLTKRS